MLSMDNLDRFIDSFTAWARQNAGVLGAAIVGSHARGTARADSDLDLVILCQDPSVLLHDDSWLQTWGKTTSKGVEDYGALTSLRAFYAGGLEVEFGLTTPNWAAIPVDPGTRNVVCAGMKILYDPKGFFENLKNAVADEQRNKRLQHP
jgi:predicted nucleotidyltransferase